MTKPNFFIVGAPKCGTTALYTYLKAHPDIYMPYQKEPHHFATDLLYAPRYTPYRDRNVYLALFADATREQRIGEASVCYLYSRCAAQAIYDFNPDARIIIMLRSPAEMMYSLYYQQVFSGEEPLPSFAEALAAENDRRQGKNVPAGLLTPVECLFYRDMARYTGQVRRYFDTFGREAVHVIIYDDFRADTAATYRLALEFLDVDPDFRADFRVVNRSKRIRSKRFRDFYLKPPAWYIVLMRMSRRAIPASARHATSQLLLRSNTQPADHSPMDPKLRAQLQQEFIPEIEDLSELLGRDLTRWCVK